MSILRVGGHMPWVPIDPKFYDIVLSGQPWFSGKNMEKLSLLQNDLFVLDIGFVQK